ncbi:MAG: YceI family protein [Ilumatobacteraceae bacterium]
MSNSLPLTSGRWVIDPNHTDVGFTVRHLGLAKVRGRFGDVNGFVDVADGVETTRVEADVALASVATGNADRDAHLQSSDFFNAESNPTMRFVSTSINGQDEDYTLAGDLTINGITKAVELEVEFFGTSTMPMDQSTRAGFSASGNLSRKDFGIEFNVPLGGDKMLISDKVTLELDVQLVAPATVDA